MVKSSISTPIAQPDEDFDLSSSDGYPIYVSYFKSSVPDSNKVTLIGGGAGLVQYRYYKFARYLSEQGYHVYTFDYRGMGKSKRRSLKNESINLSDWAEKDMASLIDSIQKQWPSADYYFVGHCMSCHLLPLIEQNGLFKKIAFVATAWGAWNQYPNKYWIGLHVQTWVPLITELVGYLPSSMFQGAEDLPKGVVREWRKWFNHPDMSKPYTKSIRYIESITCPVRLFYCPYDTIAPYPLVKLFGKQLTNAKVDFKNLDELWQKDKSQVKHHGFFKEKFNVLWHCIPEFFRFKI
ncbi:MAG: alpha/beta fold hydrolase [Aureispira sp.]|nr:alpha/beta fold hydrolase [Aureispira sp.]